ncbi:hypothetical protein O4H53_14435 [Sulfitobacter sp. G21635-S1]|uniref:hypothetical protein n=1 Tax=Sulfitobacter sp. G21635-S1 TaxID=3014043 RepID=UPI0022AFAAE9|nr:hypothetical protein [Sulfitobacter sp. G21635-S1]MCZ4256746.1 hypothetical protein [Sulfitobacter sp. G21635-S1]
MPRSSRKSAHFPFDILTCGHTCHGALHAEMIAHGIYFSTWEKFDTMLTGGRFALMFGGAQKTIA